MDWLIAHGLTIAYGFMIILPLALFAVLFLGAVLLKAWWDSVR